MERLPRVSKPISYKIGPIWYNNTDYRASNTWEPEENIYAKDKIEDFEAKFRQLPKATEKRKRKPVKESQIDPDFDFDDIPIGKLTSWFNHFNHNMAFIWAK